MIEKQKQNIEAEDEDLFVSLDLDDNVTIETRVLTIFDVGKQDYIALLPLNEDGSDNDEGNIYLYRYFEDREGNPLIENIQSEDEYELAADRFDELFDLEDSEG